MSVETCPTDTMPPCMDDVILPRAHDIVGFEVRRALPARSGKMVGPFIFFDQMGPGEFLTGRGLDVRPHPHIGLSTVTYLFDGAIQHRDSLDTDQYIQSGDVNWMTAGCGITHSERTAAPARTHSNRLFGIQSWVALPKQHEEAAPDFTHHDAAALPVIGGCAWSPAGAGYLASLRDRRSMAGIAKSAFINTIHPVQTYSSPRLADSGQSACRHETR